MKKKVYNKHWWLVKQSDKTWKPMLLTWKKRNEIPDKKIYKLPLASEKIAFTLLEYRKSKGLM